MALQTIAKKPAIANSKPFAKNTAVGWLASASRFRAVKTKRKTGNSVSV